MVEEYGRSYEFGLATRHYLKHFPLRLPNMAPMGIGMLTKERMTVRPKRIRNIKQLKAILKRAKELEADVNDKAIYRRAQNPEEARHG
jgi:heterodisulfide reductase subunit C/quinone-modifying oxidoreductase subunit QmoC